MTEDVDPRFLAAVQLVGRTGAEGFQIRYQDDDEPVVWVAIATYREGRACGAGFDPVEAVLRLADELIDGGTCAHCGKPTGVVHSPDEMPLGFVCWYQFDPELAVYRRGCE